MAGRTDPSSASLRLTSEVSRCLLKCCFSVKMTVHE